MDTIVWERATARSAEIDRRESRLVRRAAIATGALLVLLITGHQLGVTRPALSFNGNSIGATLADTHGANLSLEVRNRGLFAERIIGFSFDHPGVTIDSATFRPESLGAFDEGFLDISLTVDCAAELDGHPVWADGPVVDAQGPVRISTHRPWGSVDYSDGGFGPDLAWQIVQAAAGVCEFDPTP